MDDANLDRLKAIAVRDDDLGVIARCLLDLIEQHRALAGIVGDELLDDPWGLFSSPGDGSPT
jgi:hypothetical protein